MSTARKVVALTGLNGFIPTHVALQFLNHGWVVRGSVRSESKAQGLKTHPTYKDWIEKKLLEVVVVEDLSNADFSELLEGVSAVAHLAAPSGVYLDTWEGYKRPTIDGVINLLEQAAKVSSIESVALMSSLAALFNPVPQSEQVGKVYTEDDWFPYGEAECEAADPKDPSASVIWYCAGKKLAEQAANDFIKTHKPRWTFASVLPPMTYGPLLNVSKPEEFKKLQGVPAEFATLVGGKGSPLPPTFSTSWVDVRNVAEAFYEVIVRKKEGRFLLYSGDFSYQILADTARALRPDLDEYIPLGQPDAPDVLAGGTWSMDSSRSIKELDIKYNTKEKMLTDSLEYFEKIGAVMSSA